MKAQSDANLVSAALSDFALIKVTEWSDDERDSRIYRISANMLNLLRRFLEEGYIARELRHELLQTLSSLPSWAALDLDSLNAAQRQAVVGAYISANFVELAVDCEVSLSSN